VFYLLVTMYFIGGAAKYMRQILFLHSPFLKALHLPYRGVEWTRAVARGAPQSRGNETMTETLTQQLVVWGFMTLLAWAAWSDYRHLLIPNRICLGILVLYVAYLPVSGLELAEIGWSFAVAAGLFAFGTLLFARGMIGGGDVKLMTVVGLWAGSDLAVDYIFLTTLAGGLLALAVALPPWLAILCPSIMRFVPAGSGAGSSDSGAAGRPSLPYGIAIAAGGVYVALTILGR
jgi:prepilin peptidase CpaA